MSYGRVYTWELYSAHGCDGYVTESIVPLLHLDPQEEGKERLYGRYVLVRNGGVLNEPDPATGNVRTIPIGNAQPDTQGDFLFQPKRGGGRMDKVLFLNSNYRKRYIEASHFGEVNTYFHLDRIAAYVNTLLHELDAPPLPCVTAVVHAHHAVTEKDGLRDGVWRNERWLPFQGGHYRLPSRHFSLPEYESLSPYGEIHLGPGWQLLEDGALAERAGRPYRANASHNAGILYHEYGHHIARYTADFQANALRRPKRQQNSKTALDEGTCDYWAATMLGTPHIWAWHHRHDAHVMHPRSLLSARTMAEYNAGAGADPHYNGTIWAAALWNLRTQMLIAESDGQHLADLLVLKTLLLLGKRNIEQAGALQRLHHTREDFIVGLKALLHADALLSASRHRELILDTFARRGIQLTHDMGEEY